MTSVHSMANQPVSWRTVEPGLSLVEGPEATENQAGATAPKLSFVVVLSQSWQDVPHIVRALRELSEGLAPEYAYEVVFVDDGSTDSTFERLAEEIAGWEQAKAVKLRTRFGEAAALAAALEHSTGDVIVYLTARVRPNIRDIRNLLDKLGKGFDLVVGWRYPRRDSWFNRIISRTFNALVSWFTGVRLHDVNSGVFVARREVLQSIPFYGDLNNFLPVMAERQGFRIAEEKIEQMPGWFRQSRYPREYLQRALDLITVVFLTRYSKKPLHFLGFLGAVFTLFGIVISGYLFVYRILGMGPIAGRPLLLLGALLLVIGIQMISIGLLAEMIIFTHAGDIREYSIERILEHREEKTP